MNTSSVFKIAAIAAGLVGCFVLMPTKPADTTSPLAAAISAIRLQEDLVSLEQTRTEAIVNTRTSFLMTAETTTILTSKVSWRTSLHDIRTELRGSTLYVHLPPTVPSEPIVDIDGVKSYDNGSLMFIDEDVRAEMVRESVARAKRNAATDRSAMPTARQNAVNTVERMLSMVGSDKYTIKVD